MKDLVKAACDKEERMILHDPIYDKKLIAEMYQGSYMYILPSYREGLPLTLFEAMASGLPIVATPVNGVPYEMKDPDNGFLVPYGDIPATKEAIEKLLDNEELAKKVSKENIKLAKKYDWDIIADRTLEVFEGLVKK